MNRMISKTVISIVFFTLLTFFTSCEKYDRDIEGDINIYLLDNYTNAENSMKIISDGIKLSEEPVISYNEIIEYNSNEYRFKLTAAASDRISDKFGSAFAVTLGNEIIYTGYFWSSFSSATVDWIVIDILLNDYNNVMTVQLGYPWHFDEWSIPDKRNDNRLLSVFARDNKLKD